jgi:hypothetical protein
MRKIILLFSLVLLSFVVSAQGWQWAGWGRGSTVEGISNTVDAWGNAYEMGSKLPNVPDSFNNDPGVFSFTILSAPVAYSQTETSITCML